MANVQVTDTTTPKAAPIAVASTWAAARRALTLDLLAVGVSCALFLALALYQLDLPGLYQDEAFDVIPTMQILLGHPVELQRNAGVHILGLALPLMSSSDYQGVTSTYLALPFFAVFGINVYALRLMTVCVGVLALVLAFFLAMQWFGRPAGRVAVLLLAVSPSWVFWSRLGVYVVSEVVPLAAGALLAFTIWARRRPLGLRNSPLYWGMFLLGLGLATKILFIWLIVALAGAVAILYGRQIADYVLRIAYRSKESSPITPNAIRNTQYAIRRWSSISLAAAGAFCVGAFPFLLYNAMTRGTLYVLRANAGSTPNGVNNSAVMRNLWTEADAFRVLLDGSYFWFQGRLAAVYYDPLTPMVFAISALGLVALILARRSNLAEDRKQRTVGKGLVAAFSILLSSLFLAGVLAALQVEGTAGKALTALAIGLGAMGIAWITVLGIRRDEQVAATGWGLLAAGAVSGAIWWFGGSGRPEGPAPGGLLGLWPVDAAGVLFWLCGAGLLIVLGFDRNPAAHQRPLVAALCIIGLVVAQSAVTLSGLWATHLLLILPLPQIIIAAFLTSAPRFRRQAAGSAVQSSSPPVFRVLPSALCITALVALDLMVAVSYHRDLAITGGGSTFSDAIYRLANYLDTQSPPPQVVAMDWGFKRPLQLLTQERINPLEAYGYSAEPTPAFRQSLRELLGHPGTLYLFHTEQGTAFHRFDAFMQEVKSAGKQASLVKTFNHRDGTPNYNVYSVK